MSVDILARDEAEVLMALNLGGCSSGAVLGLAEAHAEEWLAASRVGDPRGLWLLGLAVEYLAVRDTAQAFADLAQRLDVRELRRSLLFARAAEGGYAPAMYSHARQIERDDEGAAESRAWLERAADGGFAPALVRLAVRILEDRPGFEEASRAVGYLRRAAMAGSAAAHFNLAACLAHGIGTEPDPDAATEALRHAAELGHAGARCLVQGYAPLPSCGLTTPAACPTTASEQQADHPEPGARSVSRPEPRSSASDEEADDDELPRGPYGEPLRFDAVARDWSSSFEASDPLALADELLAAAQSPLVSLDNLISFAQILMSAAAAQPVVLLNELLRKLLPGLGLAERERAAAVALVCGGLVEGGAAANLAYAAVEAQILALLDAMRSPQRSSPGLSAEREHDIAFECFAQPAIAMLSRDAELRRSAARDELLPRLARLGSAHGLANQLARLLKVIDGAPFLVVDPHALRAYRVVVGGVADNSELLVLLAAQLVGPRRRGLLAGELPPPEVVASAKGMVPQHFELACMAPWDAFPWTGLRADFGLPSGSDGSVPEHGIPADIERFDELRVLLVRPPQRPRPLHVAHPFGSLRPNAYVAERLQGAAVEALLARMAGRVERA